MLTVKEIGHIMRRMKDYPSNCGQQWMTSQDISCIDTERLLKVNPEHCLKHG